MFNALMMKNVYLFADMIHGEKPLQLMEILIIVFQYFVKVMVLNPKDTPKLIREF